MKIRSEGDKKYSEYICVVYSFLEEDTVSESPSKYQDEDKVGIIPHGKSIKNKRPCIRTSKDIHEEEDLLLESNNTLPEVYDKLLSETEGPLTSRSQSHEPRDLQQIYRRKSLLKKKDKNENTTSTSPGSISEDIINILRAQKTNNIINSVVTSAAYYILIKTDRQINDIIKFCCIPHNSAVLGIDTTYNPCDLWLTDTCYRNKRLINPPRSVKATLKFLREFSMLI